MNIQTFIFNWRGQYTKTVEKVLQLKAIGVNPIVINSDDEHTDPGWVNIGEESYFTAQFLKAIDLLAPDADVLFHIQGDASYDNWEQLYADAKKYYDIYKWGIYAPNVNYTWYNSERTDLVYFLFEEPNLRMVANTDCTCWFIHKDVIQMAKDKGINFAPYKMGWSFDIIFPALCHMNKKPVIRDYAHTISHPEGTNYNKEQAEREMVELFNSCPPDVQQAFSYIKTDISKLYDYYKD